LSVYASAAGLTGKRRVRRPRFGFLRPAGPGSKPRDQNEPTRKVRPTRADTVEGTIFHATWLVISVFHGESLFFMAVSIL
jgi:hypothetical protein